MYTKGGGAPSAIQIVEVAPRDGLQNESARLTSSEKAQLVRRAVSAGARRVEVCSFVSPRAVPQMADAADVMAQLRGEDDLRSAGVSLIGLALNRRGVDRALAAEVDEVNFVVIASETFNQRNQGASIRETMSELAAAAEIARRENVPVSLTIGAAFGCPFEGAVPLERVTGLAVDAVSLGAGEIAVADTVGLADPLAVERTFSALRAALPYVRMRGHFHDTRNTGLANAYAAWRAGAAALDASIGGVGGCPFAPSASGNIATEDLAYMLERMEVSTGLDLQRLIETSRWLSARLGKSLPSALARAGGFPASQRFAPAVA